MPHFLVYYTASYGLNREQLEELNFLIKSSDPIPYGSTEVRGFDDAHLCSLTFCISREEKSFRIPLRNPKDSKQPRLSFFGILFLRRSTALATLYPGKTRWLVSATCLCSTQPLISDILQDYELRFPRMTKFFRTAERDWRQCASLVDCRKAACETLGLDPRPTHNDLEYDEVGVLFGKHGGYASVQATLKRKAVADSWERRLMEVHRKATRTWADETLEIEAPGADETPPRKRVRTTPRHELQPLATMTNYIDLTLSPTPSLEVQRPSSPRTPRRQNHESPQSSPTVDRRSRTHRSPKLSLTPTRPSSQIKRKTLYLSPPTSPVKPLRASPVQRIDHAPNTEQIYLSIPSSPLAETTANVAEEFFKSSVTWFARQGRSRGKPSRDMSWKKQIYRVHELKAVLTGCGWGADANNRGQVSPWIHRGVVFVDPEDDEGRRSVNIVLKTVRDQQGRMSGSALLVTKPILIFDTRTFEFTGSDLESQAIHVLR